MGASGQRDTGPNPWELFDAAQAAHRRLGDHIPTAELLKRPRRLLEREGRLSIPLINADPDLLESHALARRFGGLTPLYRMLGYVQPRNADEAAARVLIKRWRKSVTGFIQDLLTDGLIKSRLGTIAGAPPRRYERSVHAKRLIFLLFVDISTFGGRMNPTMLF